MGSNCFDFKFSMIADMPRAGMQVPRKSRDVGSNRSQGLARTLERSSWRAWFWTYSGLAESAEVLAFAGMMWLDAFNRGLWPLFALPIPRFLGLRLCHL